MSLMNAQLVSLAFLSPPLPRRAFFLHHSSCTLFYLRTFLRTSLHIPPTPTTATQSHLYHSTNDRTRGRNPHEDEHLDSQFRSYIDCLRRIVEHVFQNYEHNCSDYGGSGGDEGGEESEEADGEGGPATVD